MQRSQPRLNTAIACTMALALLACGGQGKANDSQTPPVARASGCPGTEYPNPAQSLYVLPWPVGQSVRTGLTHCSGAHSGRADPFAYDFDLPEGAPFHAARGGRVDTVENDQPSSSGGGGVGNHVVIDPGDGSQGVYANAPRGGIQVRVGDAVRPGDVLGVVGRSGMAGHPHLHFVVATGQVPQGVRSLAVNFRNADPADTTLRSQTRYRAMPHCS